MLLIKLTLIIQSFYYKDTFEYLFKLHKSWSIEILNQKKKMVFWHTFLKNYLFLMFFNAKQK